MRILVATDAWHPQVNGVVRTLTTLKTHLTAGGHDAVMMFRELEKRRVAVSPRNGAIRFATHMFNDESDIDRALGALADILRG